MTIPSYQAHCRIVKSKISSRAVLCVSEKRFHAAWLTGVGNCFGHNSVLILKIDPHGPVQCCGLGSKGRNHSAKRQTLLDYTVPSTTPDNGMYDGRAAIDRIMLPQMYGGDYWPREQYVDDVEIWNGFPPDASPDLP